MYLNLYAHPHHVYKAADKTVTVRTCIAIAYSYNNISALYRYCPRHRDIQTVSFELIDDEEPALYTGKYLIRLFRHCGDVQM